MKLFLSSHGITENLSLSFLDLVGKKATDIKFAHVVNAADTYPAGKRGFVDDVRKQFKNIGLRTDEIDLRKVSNGNDPYRQFSRYDVIWFGGGNAFYLRYILKKTRLDGAIKRLIKEGTVYGGDSAGAIIATPTLKYVDLIDEPDDAPEVIEEGLGLVDFAIVPHWGYEKYQSKLKQMRDSLTKEGYRVKVISDNQAVRVIDNSVKIVGDA